MKFIEMTGKKLGEVVQDDEMHVADFAAAGITDDTVVRVNEHGDIEVRRSDSWDLVGGLLGEYNERIKRVTGLDWVDNA